jgi:hemolysin III
VTDPAVTDPAVTHPAVTGPAMTDPALAGPAARGPGAGTSEAAAPHLAASAVLRLSGQGTAPVLRGWLHLGAFVLSVPAGILLARHAAGRASVLLYAVTLAALYGVSAAYHLLPLPTTPRRWMRRADHAMIYVFMAAAYTPFAVLAARGTPDQVTLWLLWVGTALGVAIKLASVERTRLVGGLLYLLLGWVPLIALPSALPRLDAAQLALMVTMGALFTVGVVVLATRHPDPYPEVFGYHEVWHAMVILATACYFPVVWSLAGPAGA